MKERPILFSAPMVRAILSGKKTQTRRAVKGEALRWLTEAGFSRDFTADPENHLCPYGAPGDRLWVRETWADMGACWMYLADDVHAHREGWATPPGLKWKPSIHMPRAASRITLQITDVRVQRLQDISEEDAKAEGLKQVRGPIGSTMWEYSESEGGQFADPRVAFCMLWESINGAGSWDANPWVWALTFERVKP